MFYEPVNEIIADEQLDKVQNAEKDSSRRLRFYKFPTDRSSELIARLLIYNNKLSWRAFSYKHFRVGTKIYPCIDGYKNVDKLNAAQSLFFKPYIYDQEARQQIPLIYNENVKKEYFEKYFNVYEINSYNPQRVLELISPDEEDLTLSAIRKTAEYLTISCPICSAIKRYGMSLDSNYISQYKSVVTYYLLIVDMSAINLFNQYASELGYDYKSLKMEDVVFLAQSFTERYPERTILPQILNITSSQYTKLINDLKKYKDVLSATRGTNVIFRKILTNQKNRFQNAHSFDLSSVNTPIHVNPNVMEYISNNMYDLDKIFLPPSLDIVKEIQNSDEIKSFEMMLASAVAKKQKDFGEQVKKIVYNTSSQVDVLPSATVLKPTVPVSSNEKKEFQADTEIKQADTEIKIEKIFRYKLEALKKNKNNPLPSCYGDKNVYNLSSMKCYNCPVNFYCYQEQIHDDNLPF